MNLNLPIVSQIAGKRNILLAGMGGGFDIFCGLPLYIELRTKGWNVHLANFSFADIEALSGGDRLSPTLVGVHHDSAEVAVYFPEFYLAQWLKERFDQRIPVWSFHKTGAVPLLENYRLLVKTLAIDAIILVDGGVDSLLRGDEEETGTLIEDSLSLFAVNALSDISSRMIVCLGFGAEESIAYTQVLENIASLTKTGGFWGACSLTPEMEAYKLYEEAVLYAQAKPYQDPSVINSCIVSAARGHFGNFHLTKKTKGSRLSISPLMLLYWFFELSTVARHHLFLSSLKDTQTFMQAVFQHVSLLAGVPKRVTPRIGI
jgi:hypothetical protein